ncbi:MAG: DUF3050 domain-containing protein, partial [Sulfuricellaceae bacterium]
LDSHPVYGAVRTVEDLQAFMSHHVFSVWDFMSVVKYLQNQIAPTTYPWKPRGHPSVRYFINQLVLEEESDQGLPAADGSATFASHFELYCDAMREIGADPTGVLNFVEIAAEQGITAALALGVAPAPSHQFMESTFAFIGTGKPHMVAAAFALGREHIIPGMFRAFLKDMGITDKEAPAFHYYLNRHIHLDADFHGPISLQLLNELIGGDPAKMKEAEEAARAAVEARIRFWDGVMAALGR